MRITDIEYIPVQAPGRTAVIVLVDTDEGITGVGEAGLQRRPLAIDGAVQHLRRGLIGGKPDAHRASLAENVPRRILPRRPLDRLGHQRH